MYFFYSYVIQHHYVFFVFYFSQNSRLIKKAFPVEIGRILQRAFRCLFFLFYSFFFSPSQFLVGQAVATVSNGRNFVFDAEFSFPQPPYQMYRFRRTVRNQFPPSPFGDPGFMTLNLFAVQSKRRFRSVKFHLDAQTIIQKLAQSTFLFRKHDND